MPVDENTIPTSSAYIERRFSDGVIKNNRRNGLNLKLQNKDKTRENSYEEVEVSSEDEISDYEDYIHPVNYEENNVNEVYLTVDEENSTYEESLDDEEEVSSDSGDNGSSYY